MSDARDDIFPITRRPEDRAEKLEPAGQPAESATPSSPQLAEAPSEEVPPDEVLLAEAPPAEVPPAEAAPVQPAARDKVVLEFGSFREFIDEYSAYISGDGIFLLDSPRRPGDEVAFEVRLSDDFRLAHGSGTIEWFVPVSTPDHPAGAALRFTELDEPSRRLVARLVDNHRSTGGTPFDIDARPPGAADQGAGEPERLPPLAAPGIETIQLPVSLTAGMEERAEPENGDVETLEPAEPSPLPIDDDLVPIDEADFDAAKTQVVTLPEDLRLEEPPPDLAADEPSGELPELVTPPEEAPDETGFEPAELPQMGEAGAAGEPEEVLPVMPLEGGITAEALEAVDSAVAAAPEVVEGLGEAATEPAIEIPDEADLVGDFYRSSGPRRRRTFLWAALCVLAVVLGAAAWMYRDVWMPLLPASITGGGPETAVPAAPPPPDPGPADPGEQGPEPADAGPSDEITAPAEPAAAPDRGDETEERGAASAGAAPAEPADPQVVVAPAPVATTPAAAPSSGDSPPSGGPGKVTDLSSRIVGEVTEVLIATDAALAPDGFRILRVTQPPARQVIKIYGPDEPFPREAVAVGTEHVRRLRTGFHRVDGRGEVHVVVDLTGPGIAVLGTEVRGSTLVVRFGRP